MVGFEPPNRRQTRRQARRQAAHKSHGLTVEPLRGTDALRTFGSGFSGKLGHGEQRNRSMPTPIRGLAHADGEGVGFGEEMGEMSETGGGFSERMNGLDERVGGVAVLAAGALHSLAATSSDGALYSFGSNSAWQLGHGELRHDEL